MPRDASGNYTLPTGNPVITQTTVSSVWANTTMNDLKAEMQDSLSRSGNGSMLAPLKHTDGTVGAPAVTFTTAANSGMYRAATGDIRFALQGVDSFRILAGELQVWDVTDSQWYPLASSKSIGAVLERVTLGAAQTVVPFTKNVAGAAIYLDATSGDRGRIYLTDDYTYDSVTNEITLLTTYPTGTKVTAVINDETDVNAATAAAAASAQAAATSETNAATSETNAANSASAAATSEANAATSETNAANSASAANISATNAATSASAAATSETNAATSETNAANSASSASTDAATASSAATTATTAASNAATSETNAANSASAAATSETNAANSASAAATSAQEAADSAASINPTDLVHISGAETITGPKRGAITVDNDLSFDLSAGNNFKATPAGSATLVFTNIASGQSGNIWFDNSGGFLIGASAAILISADDLVAISTAGVYWISYNSDGVNTQLTASASLTSGGA